MRRRGPRSCSLSEIFLRLGSSSPGQGRSSSCEIHLDGNLFFWAAAAAGAGLAFLLNQAITMAGRRRRRRREEAPLESSLLGDLFWLGRWYIGGVGMIIISQVGTFLIVKVSDATVGLNGMMSRFVKFNNNNNLHHHLQQQQRYPDLYHAASDSDTVSSSSSAGSCFSLDLCPDIVLAVIAAAAAAGAYFLYITITQAGRRRRRRNPAPVLQELGEVLISGPVDNSE